MDHHQELHHNQASTDKLSTPLRHPATMSSSSSRKQQSPTSVTATAHFDAAAASLKISLDPVGEDDDDADIMKTPKDLPMLEDASDSQESDVEREFRSLLECALWQRQFLSSTSSRRTSKLVEWLWTRRWDRFQDRLSSMRHRHEVGEETELPCFTHCRGLPLHLACSMRPLPPFKVIQQLVQAFPHAAQLPESSWGMLPLHLLADLRFQRRTGGPKQQQPSGQPSLANDELKEVDLESTDSSNSGTVSEADAEDQDDRHITKTDGCDDYVEPQTLEHDCSPAAHHGKVLEVVLNAFPDAVKAREKLSGMLPLHIAACTGYSHNGLVSETSFVVLELLTKHEPETKWIKDDWGQSAVAVAWKETVFHCALCSGPERSNRCSHVWSLPSRFINPLFKSEKREALRAEGTGSHPSKESGDDKKSSFPTVINLPVEIAISIASGSESWNGSQKTAGPKRSSYEDALAGALLGKHDHISHLVSMGNDGQTENDRAVTLENSDKEGEAMTSRSENMASKVKLPASQGENNASRGEHTASHEEPTASPDSSSRNNRSNFDGMSHYSTQTKHNNENSSLLRNGNGGVDTIINLNELEILKKSDLEERLKHKRNVPNPIGKEVFVDTRFGPFGDRFGVDAKSLLTIRIHVSHLKAGKGKAKIGALVKAPNPYVELAVVAKGKKTLVYQSHPLVHRSEATWEAQEISLGLGIKTMYKQAACLFTVYHCRRKGGTPLLIGTYYCAFKDLPTSSVAICRSGKPKGLLCINSFSLEEIPKPCDRVRL